MTSMIYEGAASVAIGSEDVAITITYGMFGHHLGIAFGNGSDKAPKLVHLAFHRLLKIDDFPGENWAAKIIPLPTDLSAQIVALLHGLSSTHFVANKNTLNYGINVVCNLGSFTGDGEYVPPENADGHTCSSFVADIFASLGVPLVDLTTWTLENPENEAWKDAVVCLLRAWAKTRHGTGTEAVAQAKAVAKVREPLRLTPEEVAAAGSLPLNRRPASQNTVAPIAAQIAAELSSVCKQTAPPQEFEHCVKKYSDSITALRQRQH